MKEYKVVQTSEGLKGIHFGNKVIRKNISVLTENYAQDGWEVFQFVTTFLGDIVEIIFVRDKS